MDREWCRNRRQLMKGLRWQVYGLGLHGSPGWELINLVDSELLILHSPKEGENVVFRRRTYPTYWDFWMACSLMFKVFVRTSFPYSVFIC